MSRPRTDHLKPWQPGDPVGCGKVYLPDRKTREAYGAACKAWLVECAAQTVIAQPDLETRRRIINRFPQGMRDALKARVIELWKEKQNAA